MLLGQCTRAVRCAVHVLLLLLLVVEMQQLHLVQDGLGALARAHRHGGNGRRGVRGGDAAAPAGGPAGTPIPVCTAKTVQGRRPADGQTGPRVGQLPVLLLLLLLLLEQQLLLLVLLLRRQLLLLVLKKLLLPLLLQRVLQGRLRGEGKR